MENDLYTKALTDIFKSLHEVFHQPFSPGGSDRENNNKIITPADLFSERAPIALY